MAVGRGLFFLSIELKKGGNHSVIALFIHFFTPPSRRKFHKEMSDACVPSQNTCETFETMENLIPPSLLAEQRMAVPAAVDAEDPVGFRAFLGRTVVVVG